MAKIEAFTCGRGMIVAFEGGNWIKTRRQYIQYRNGTYTLVSECNAVTLFDWLKITASYRSHASSDYFSRVKLDAML